MCVSESAWAYITSHPAVGPVQFGSDEPFLSTEVKWTKSGREAILDRDVPAQCLDRDTLYRNLTRNNPDKQTGEGREGGKEGELPLT